MARLIRPLRQWPLFRRHCCPHAVFNYILSGSLIISCKTTSPFLSFPTATASNGSVHNRPRGLKLPNAQSPIDFEEGGYISDSDSDAKKSRNQKKREARRAVRWGMELASFSPLQIKRIMRVASLEREVFNALMLVKRLGPDVREGKRRQYNYIGKLLRDVEPELMDALIYSTKDGDWSRLQGFSGLEMATIVDDDDEKSEDTEFEEEEEGSQEYINIANRWFDGLVNKDIKITNEVYAIRNVDFDRQELRKLVRRVHAVHERKGVTEENEQVDSAIMAAKKSLTRFLYGLAKQMPNESIHIDL